MTARGVVSDLGNVVVMLRRRTQAETLAAAPCIPRMSADAIDAKLEEPAWHELLRQFECDEIDPALFRLQAEDHLGTRVSEHIFWEAFVDIFTTNEPVVELLRLVKTRSPRVKIVTCSDTDRRRLPWIVGLTHGIFDRFVASFMVGKRKPAVEVWDLVRKKTGLDPEELVYIDDLEGNVRGAASYGMIAHRYDPMDPERNLKLERLLRAHGLI